MCLVLFAEYRDLNENYPYPEQKRVQWTQIDHKDQLARDSSSR